MNLFSIATIRKAALAGGGVPRQSMALQRSSGEIVVWETSGEVRTAVRASQAAIRENAE